MAQYAAGFYDNATTTGLGCKALPSVACDRLIPAKQNMRSFARQFDFEELNPHSLDAKPS